MGSKSVQDLSDTINAASSETGVIASATVTAGDGSGTKATIEWTFEAVNAGSSSQVAVSGATGVFSGTYGVTQGNDATFTIAGTDESNAAITLNSADYKVEGNKVTYTKGNAEGLSFTLENTTGGNITVNDINTLSLQIGANEKQTMEVAIQRYAFFSFRGKRN